MAGAPRARKGLCPFYGWRTLYPWGVNPFNGSGTAASFNGSVPRTGTGATFNSTPRTGWCGVWRNTRMAANFKTELWRQARFRSENHSQLSYLRLDS